MRKKNPNLKLVISPKSDLFNKIYQNILDIKYMIEENKVSKDIEHVQSSIDDIYYKLYAYNIEILPDYISSQLKNLSSKVESFNETNENQQLITRNIGDIRSYNKFKDKNWNNLNCYYPYLHTISSNKELTEYLEAQKDNPNFNINIQDTFFNTSLLIAIKNDDLDKVKTLAKYGAISSEKYYPHYKMAMHLSIFSSPKVFKFIYSLEPEHYFESDLIEDLLEEFIITPKVDKNLSFIFRELRSSKDKFDFGLFIESAIKTDSKLLLEYALSNKTIISWLYKPHYLLNHSYFFDFLLSTTLKGKENLSIFKFLISKYPPDIFDITSSKTRSNIRTLFNRMIISKCDYVFYQCLIQTLIKKSSLNSLIKIRKAFKKLTSNPYVSDYKNPLIHALSIGQENIANLFFKYGAEIPTSAISGKAYVNNKFDHPIKVSINANCPNGIDLLYKYGIRTSTKSIEDRLFCKYLYDHALGDQKYECADKLKEILLKDIISIS